MKKILVASDGSDNSERAVLESKKHAEYIDAEITILTIIKPLGRYTTVGYRSIPIDKELKNEAGSILKKSVELLGDFKGEILTKIKKGDPADEIIDEAEDGDYDLIIMGSRGLGTFTKTMLGSVSNKVLNHSEKNILIVK